MSIELMVALGLLSGVAAGFFGIGGGVILVPCFLFLGLDMEQAIGISIMQMVFSSIFGSIINIAQKKLDIQNGIFVGIGGLLGASFSGFIVSVVSSQILLICFCLLSAISFYKYAFNIKTSANANPPTYSILQKRLILVAAGMTTGIFAISLGVGGGLILAPILAHYLGFDSKKIVPISLFFIIFASSAGSISLANHNLIDYHTGMIVGLSSMCGVAFGIWLISKTNVSKHRFALLGIYFISLSMTIYKIIQSFI